MKLYKSAPTWAWCHTRGEKPRPFGLKIFFPNGRGCVPHQDAAEHGALGDDVTSAGAQRRDGRGGHGESAGARASVARAIRTCMSSIIWPSPTPTPDSPAARTSRA